MSFKKLIILFIILILVFSTGIFLFKKYKYSQDRQHFLSILPGKVVFTRRNSDGVSDIWKINANGTDEQMVFHNELNDFLTDSRKPQWSDDNGKIYFLSFDKNKKEIIYEFDINTKNTKITSRPSDYKLDDTKKWVRDSDITHREGDLFILENNSEIKIYNHIGPYNQDYMSGASEASWGPNKKYIIFQAQGYIMIADLNANVFKLTSGDSPNWR